MRGIPENGCPVAQAESGTAQSSQAARKWLDAKKQGAHCAWRISLTPQTAFLERPVRSPAFPAAGIPDVDTRPDRLACALPSEEIPET
jgi:hypothetical protein